MENRNPAEENTKKLILVIIFMSALVILLYGLIPML